MRIFTYQSVDNADKHKVIHVDDERQAQELVESGKAVKLDLPELDEYERKASELHAKYKKQVDAIRNSDDPRITDEVKEWEIGKIDESYEAETAQLEQEYAQWRQAQQADAKKRAARAVVSVTKDDEQVASQLVIRASLNLATATDDEKSVIVSQIVEDISHLSDGEKTAMQAQIGELLSGLDSTQRNTLVDAVKDVRNSDLLAEKVADQLPVDILSEKRISDIAKKVVADSTFSHGQGGIDNEFYEKHLKGDDK